jgi:hypothetical protein
LSFCHSSKVGVIGCKCIACTLGCRWFFTSSSHRYGIRSFIPVLYQFLLPNCPKMTQPHSLNRANSINIVMAERLMGKGFGAVYLVYSD